MWRMNDKSIFKATCTVVTRVVKLNLPTLFINFTYFNWQALADVSEAVAHQLYWMHMLWVTSGFG